MINKKLKFLILLLVLFPSIIFAFMKTTINLLDDVYRTSSYVNKVGKSAFTKILLKDPYSVKSFTALDEFSRMKLYMKISSEKHSIPKTRYGYYLDQFKNIDGGGEKLLINAIKENKNLDDVLLKYSSRMEKQTKSTSMSDSLKLYPNTMTQSKTYLGDKIVSTKFEVKGFVNNVKTHSFVDGNGNIVNGKIKDIIDLKRTIKMPYLGSNAPNANAAGFLRDYKKFGQDYAKRYPETLSNNNRLRIKNGLSPKVDKRWIKYNPNHKTFKGEALEHHHINNTDVAGYLPTSLHRGKVNKGLVHVD